MVMNGHEYEYPGSGLKDRRNHWTEMKSFGQTTLLYCIFKVKCDYDSVAHNCF